MSTLSTTNLKNPSSGSNNIVLAADGSSTLGTAKLTTLADSAGANTSTPEEIASGRAKAWVNFNGTGTVAIRASYNVSSITDNGTGDYAVNFTTAMADADYSVVGTIGQTVNAGGFLQLDSNQSGVDIDLTTTYATVYSVNQAGTVIDASYVCVSIFR
jgi:hypothetical protein